MGGRNTSRRPSRWSCRRSSAHRTTPRARAPRPVWRPGPGEWCPPGSDAHDVSVSRFLVVGAEHQPLPIRRPGVGTRLPDGRAARVVVRRPVTRRRATSNRRVGPRPALDTEVNEIARCRAARRRARCNFRRRSIRTLGPPSSGFTQSGALAIEPLYRDRQPPPVRRERGRIQPVVAHVRRRPARDSPSRLTQTASGGTAPLPWCRRAPRRETARSPRNRRLRSRSCRSASRALPVKNERPQVEWNRPKNPVRLGKDHAPGRCIDGACPLQQDCHLARPEVHHPDGGHARVIGGVPPSGPP